MTSYLFGLIGSLATLALVAELLRRGRLREKFAALWIAVGVLVLAACLFPGLLYGLADLLGFQAPINLVLFVSALVLLVVSVQLSAEVGTLEEESRTLAEESALLRLAAERLSNRVDELEAASTLRSPSKSPKLDDGDAQADDGSPA